MALLPKLIFDQAVEGCYVPINSPHIFNSEKKIASLTPTNVVNYDETNLTDDSE